MANDAATHPIELHELSAKPASKDVAQRMLQTITCYRMTQIVYAVAKYSIAEELARGPRLNASLMLRLTGGRVRRGYRDASQSFLRGLALLPPVLPLKQLPLKFRKDNRLGHSSHDFGSQHFSRFLKGLILKTSSREVRTSKA